MLNKTKALKTNECTENFTQKDFPNKHTSKHLKPKSILSIEHHSIEIFKESMLIQQNLKKNAPNITDALDTIENYINEILKQTRQIEQILKNMPDATNPPKSDTTNATKSAASNCLP